VNPKCLKQSLREFLILKNGWNNFTDFINCLLQEESTNMYTPTKFLITAPCQVGKTNSIIETVKDCILNGISVVISCDNKMNQLFKRLTNNYSQVFEDTLVTTVESKNFDSIKNYNTFVVCCLDNQTQIGRVYQVMYSSR
jgi:hypothetical protein